MQMYGHEYDLTPMWWGKTGSCKWKKNFILCWILKFVDWLDPGKTATIIHMTCTNNEQTKLKFLIIQRVILDFKPASKLQVWWWCTPISFADELVQWFLRNRQNSISQIT
jgi:hypothetical protein